VPLTIPYRAFILVGGLGKRLRPVVSDRPKPLAMIQNKPFLEILIASLIQKGVSDFVLLTGYKGKVIEDHFSGYRKATIRYCHEQFPLGTGGAVKNAQEYATDPTLLVNGDTFFDADLTALYDFHRKKGVAVTVSLAEVEDVGRYGSVCIDDSSFITGFSEKSHGMGAPGLVNAGLSFLSLKTIKNLPEHLPFSMETEVFPTLAASRQMVGLRQNKPFYDIGTPESYEAFQHFMRTQDTSGSH
jgi:D-glycero-alpha-D-manno-heptose 1-phosphate guanylyltransferase